MMESLCGLLLPSFHEPFAHILDITPRPRSSGTHDEVDELVRFLYGEDTEDLVPVGVEVFGNVHDVARVLIDPVGDTTPRADVVLAERF